MMDFIFVPFFRPNSVKLVTKFTEFGQEIH